MKEILDTGIEKSDRTGVGTKSLFGRQIRHNLKDGFPLLTTKKVNLNSIKTELLWFIKGNTNIRELLENKNKIWTEWPLKKYFESDKYNGPDMTNFGTRRIEDKEFNKVYLVEKKRFENAILEDDVFAEKWGDAGPIYGKQWRDFNGVDQFTWLINEIKTNPDSRRLLLSMWNPVDIPEMSLPPCPVLFQFYVVNNTLSCQVYQR